ncbi:uncharacterized protein [Ptychodera flava]|uniref:uncharacterized protein isoform X2 n=1 Tax=Ptychodera flava TaxID=63121 RepID=UPI003969FB91
MEVLYLCLFAAFFTTGSTAIPYGPECQALDDMSNSVASPLQDVQLSCNRSRECTGLSCALTYQSQTTYVTLDIHHCRTPPSMDFRMYTSDGTYDFQKTVTHGEKFEIMDFSEIPGLSELANFMHVYIATDFERVDDGLIIGIKLEAGMSEDLIMFERPILQDHRVPTPPCIKGPHLDPNLKKEQCGHMDRLMSELPYQDDFDCAKNESCMGIGCVGAISGVNVTTSMEIDNCDDPVALTITLDSSHQDFPWQHTFIHSEVVEIDNIDYMWNGMPVLVKLDMQMEPPKDGYMLTSLTYQGCASTMIIGLVCPDSARVEILDNSLIPVPPCHSEPSATLPPRPPPRLPTYPTPAPHAECKALDDMIRQLTAPQPDQHIATCTRNDNCTGINCTALYNGDDYEAYIGLHHCQDPIELIIALRSKSQNLDWQKTFTHGETVPIDGLSVNVPLLERVQIYMQVDMIKEEHDLILSMYLLFGKNQPGDIVIMPKLPLVQDEDIPLPTCDGSTRPPPPPIRTAAPPIPGKGTDKPVSPSKPSGGKPDKFHGQSGDSSPHTTSIAVGVVVAVLVVFGVIVAVVLLRRYQCLKYGGTTILLDSKSQSTSVI